MSLTNKVTVRLRAVQRGCSHKQFFFEGMSLKPFERIAIFFEWMTQAVRIFERLVNGL